MMRTETLARIERVNGIRLQHPRFQTAGGGRVGTVSSEERPMKIDEAFRAMIPPLSDDEKRLLEDSIAEEGCREALIVWREEGILLDGHHRFDICTRLGIKYETCELSLPSRDAAVEWMVKNQLGRRNLTPEQVEKYELPTAPPKPTDHRNNDVWETSKPRRFPPTCWRRS